MKRAMARQAEAEREKRAKIIAAEGESLAAAALGDASDIMMAAPARAAASQPPDIDRRSVWTRTRRFVFSGPLMSTIQEMGAFLVLGDGCCREAGAAFDQRAGVEGSRSLETRSSIRHLSAEVAATSVRSEQS